MVSCIAVSMASCIAVAMASCIAVFRCFNDRPLQIRVGTFDQEAGVKMMEVADKHQEVFKEKDMKVRGLNAEISELRETTTALQVRRYPTGI